MPDPERTDEGRFRVEMLAAESAFLDAPKDEYTETCDGCGHKTYNGPTMFQAGYERGYLAATAAERERAAELRAEVKRLAKEHAQAVQDCGKAERALAAERERAAGIAGKYICELSENHGGPVCTHPQMIAAAIRAGGK